MLCSTQTDRQVWPKNDFPRSGTSAADPRSWSEKNELILWKMQQLKSDLLNLSEMRQAGVFKKRQDLRFGGKRIKLGSPSKYYQFQMHIHTYACGRRLWIMLEKCYFLFASRKMACDRASCSTTDTSAEFFGWQIYHRSVCILTCICMDACTSTGLSTCIYYNVYMLLWTKLVFLVLSWIYGIFNGDLNLMFACVVWYFMSYQSF